MTAVIPDAHAPWYTQAMRPESSGYILKEYGSWSVLTVAFVIGLAVSRAFPWQAAPLFISLGLLINSKQAYTKWMRQRAVRMHLIVFLAQVAAAGAVLAVLFGRGIP